MARSQIIFLLVVVVFLLLLPSSAQTGWARCRNKGGDCVGDSEVIRSSGVEEAELIILYFSISGQVSLLQK